MPQPALASSAAVWFFSFRLAENLFGRAAAWFNLLLVAALPFPFVISILMMPDAPLTAAWAAMLFFLERALLGGRRSAWWGVGVALGFGMLSKYTIALLGISILVMRRRARKEEEGDARAP